MQTNGGAQAEAAILAAERRIYVDCKVDWNRNGLYNHALSDLSAFVEVTNTERSLRGSAPEELLLIEGASAAEMSVVLSGEYNGMTMDSVFSVFHGFSPFFGQELTGEEIKLRFGVETSYGVEWYDQFIGQVRTITANRSDSTAEITALDRVEVLRHPVTFPYWAVFDPSITQGNILSQLLDSTWVIDHCLRFCDTSPSPYRPVTPAEMGVDGLSDGMHLWVTGNGGHIPTIGWMGNSIDSVFPSEEAGQPVMYTGSGAIHPSVASEIANRPWAFHALTSNTGFVERYWTADRDSINTSATHWLGFTLSTEGADANYAMTAPDHEVMAVHTGATCFLSIRCVAGTLYTRFNQTGSGRVETGTAVTIPAAAGQYRVYAIWDFTGTTGTRCWLTVGPNTTGWQAKGVPLASTAYADFFKGRVTIDHRISFSDVFYSARSIFGAGGGSSQEIGKSAKYAAVLDRGRNRISFIPAPKAEEAWDVITAVASAEFGSVMWDEHGVFRFWNYDTILAKQNTVVRSITVDDVSGFEIQTALDSVRNVYSVEASRRRARYKGPIFSSVDENQFYVPASTVKYFQVWTDDIVSPLTAQIVRCTTGSSPGAQLWSDTLTSHGYVPQYLIGGVWQEQDARVSGVDINVYHSSSGAFIVRIFNGYGDPVRLAHNTATPGEGAAAFRFHGTGIEDGDDQVFRFENRTSITKYGARNFTLSGEWYQEFFEALGMTAETVPRTSRPIPIIDDIQIVGDPRLQLGDTVSVRDSEGAGEEFHLQIYGIRREYSRDHGLTDRLTTEVVRRAVGVWDSPQYGIWGSSFIWS